MSKQTADGQAAALGTTTYVQDHEIAVLAIDNPPTNALSFQVRNDLLDGLQRACRDASVHAVVMTGSERAFCSGADLRQFDTPGYAAHPRTRHLAQAIEAADKPVVAAIGGFAMGGGLELALAAHARVAQAGALLGLPEVKLGVIPAAGGLLRLPRLVGVSRAYTLIMSGATFTAEEAASWGLIDAICAADLVEHAKQFARTLIGRPVRRTLSLPLRADEFTRSDSRRDPARAAIDACFDTLCSKPIEIADQIIQRLSNELVASPRARALRYLFAAQRAAARVPAVVAIAPEAVTIDGPDTQVAERLKQAGFQVRRKSASGEISPRIEGFTATAYGATAELSVAKPSRGRAIVEIVQTRSASPALVKALVAAAKRLELIPVLTVGEPIAPRLDRAIRGSLADLIEQGAAPDAIGNTLLDAGFEGDSVRRHLQELASPAAPIERARAPAREPESLAHVLSALAREGERIVDEGIANPAAIDVVAVYGLGCPEDNGGPMYAARPPNASVMDLAS